MFFTKARKKINYPIPDAESELMEFTSASPKKDSGTVKLVSCKLSSTFFNDSSAKLFLHAAHLLELLIACSPLVNAASTTINCN